MALACSHCGCVAGTAGAAGAGDFIDEPGRLRPMSRRDKLPPVDAAPAGRTPGGRRCADRAGCAPGQHGGELRMLMARAQGHPDDGRLRLCAAGRPTTPKLELVPDILESSTCEDDRVFTLHLRQRPSLVGRPSVHHRGFPLLLGGHRQQRASLSPAGPPEDADARRATKPQVRSHRRHDRPLSLADGPTVFLPALAGARPLYILRAGALLEDTSTRKYADKAKLEEAVRKADVSATGRSSTTAKASSTATTIRTCRRWSPGC